MLKCSIVVMAILALIFSSSVLYADVDYTKDPKPSVYRADPPEAEEEEEEEGGCGGDCKGEDTATKNVFGGKCPDPCVQKFYAKLEEEAKKGARRDAIKKCQDAANDPDCICTGGVYKVHTPKCNTYPDARPGHDPTKEVMCVYHVTVEYKNGTCKNIP